MTNDLRHWMRLVENMKRQSITIKTDSGIAYGEIISTGSPGLIDWYQENGIYLRGVVRKVAAYKIIAILDYIEVTKAMRGQKIGSHLFASFKTEAIRGGAQAILLKADPDDTFDLIAWYRRLGFVNLTSKSNAMLLQLSTTLDRDIG